MTTQTCANCRYWKLRTDRGTNAGNCLRYPPARTDTLASAFPLTSTETWCGEWAKVQPEPEQEAKAWKPKTREVVVGASDGPEPDPKKNLKKVVDPETEKE